MRARIPDARAKGLVELKPARPPEVHVSQGRVRKGLAGFRDQAVASAAATALDYLGFQVRPAKGSSDLHVGADPPAGPGLWLRPGPCDGPAPVEISARGFSAGALRFYCLSAPLAAPLLFSWDELERARGEHDALCAAALGLAGAGAGQPSAVAGYLARLRAALAEGLDFRGAVACLWDALRPGALSPGSRMAVLQHAENAVGIGLFRRG